MCRLWCVIHPLLSSPFPYTTLFRSFQRAGAAPEALRATLFGKGGVQTLDGASHRRRKALFVAWTRADRVDAIGDRKSTRLNSSHVETSYAVFCENKRHPCK